MDQINSLRMNVIRMDGVRAEVLEDMARSLLNELNEHRRGTAFFAPAPPSKPDTKDILGVSPEIAIASGSFASAWIIPAVQHWLGYQKSDTGVRVTLKNDVGEDYDITIGANAPPDVIAKLSSAIVRAIKT